MNFLFILKNRLQTHFQSHILVIVLFILGVLTSALFFLYYYGDMVKASQLIASEPEVMATYQVQLPGSISPEDERIAQLAENNTVTLYHTAQLDPASQALDGQRVPEGQPLSMTLCARPDNRFSYQPWFGSADLSPGGDILLMGSPDVDSFVGRNRLTQLEDPVLVLDGVSFSVIGVHNYLNPSCIPYDAMVSHGFSVDRLDVILPHVLSEQDSAGYVQQLEQLFDGAQVTDGYTLYGPTYLTGENQNRSSNFFQGLLLLLLAVFCFLFLLKYLFDLSKGEDLVYRLVGASRKKVTLIALAEVELLTLAAALLAVLLHLVLYPTFFSSISLFPDQAFTFWDYLLIVAAVLLVSGVACIPCLVSVWRSSIVAGKAETA